MMALVILSVTMMSAQSRTVSGTVVSSADGLGLPGVSVSVKGTAKGTITEVLGDFSIEASTGDVLVFSFIGYQTHEITLADQTTIDLTLQESTELLDEVVITGYGTITKEAFTGSVSRVGSEKLEQVPLASIEQTLQGNVVGLQSTVASGQPGANAQIRIRGIGSISASSEPLIVIDGIPVIAGDLTRVNTTANTMASINPNDIESVTVLKDASATSIYGSRGSNGVILITTKSGKAGKPKLSFKTQVGFNDWSVSDSRRLRGLSSTEYTEMFLEGWMNRGESLTRAIQRFEGFYPGAVTFGSDGSIQQINVETNWVDLIQRTGSNQSYDVSVSGGTDAFTYYASGAYFKQESPIIYSGLDRYSSRLNFTAKVSEKFTITNNLNVSSLNQRGMSDGSGWANPMYNAYFLAPVIPLKDDQGRFYGNHQTFFMGGNNPVGSLSGDDERYFDQVRLMDNLSGEFEIIEGLKFKSAWAFDLINIQEFFYRNPRYGDGRNVGGAASESVINNTNYIGTQTLTYNKTINDDHRFTFLVGYEAQKDKSKRVLTQGENFPNAVLRTLANAATPTNASSDLSEFAFESILSRLDYSYNNRYYLSGSLRRDGSSRFGINNRYGTFWSVGGSWRISQESFLEGIDFINDLKLRASYGTNGNAGIGNYEHIPLFGFGADYDGSPGGAITNIGNIDLTWESTNSFNIGLDFDLFKGLNGTVEYFNRESENLLLDRPISRTTGFSSLTQNFGAMRNKGIELTLNADIISSGPVTWSVGGNVTFLNNKVTRLDEDIIDGTKIRQEGLDFQTYYLYEWAGVDPQTGTPRWFTDETMSETTGKIAEAKRFISGRSATPDFFGGFNTTVAFKGIRLDAQFSSSWGNYIYDTEARFLQGDGGLTPRSQTSLNLTRWRQPGDITNVPYFRWGGNNSSNVGDMTRWIYDGSYIRLRNLTVSYDIPRDIVSKAKIANARVYLRGINLWTFTNEDNLHLDPEAGINGIISSPVPNMKTISFGLDIGF